MASSPISVKKLPNVEPNPNTADAAVPTPGTNAATADPKSAIAYPKRADSLAPHPALGLSSL